MRLTNNYRGIDWLKIKEKRLKIFNFIYKDISNVKISFAQYCMYVYVLYMVATGVDGDLGKSTKCCADQI
jgi:hypothetical protein